MKNRLLSTVAVIGSVVGLTGAAAAQTSAAAQLPVAARPFQWTGCYIGGHAGYGWGRAEDRTFEFTTDVSGWLAGGQIGCDYQFAPSFLLGVEAMAAWTDIHGTSDPFFSGKNMTRLSAQTDWIASATARAGVTADRWLIFIKAGPAWSKGNFREYGGHLVDGPFDYRGGFRDMGWTWGVGFEWAFAPNWSAKFEFNRYDFSGNTVRLRDIFSGDVDKSLFDHKIQTVTFGINYRFATGWP